MNLARKTVVNISLVTIATFTVKFIQFLTKILLARILLPTEFGMVAIGIVIIDTFAIFRDFGLGSALIQRSKNIEIATSSTFVLTSLISVFLFLTCFFSAPFISDFYAYPDLELVIKFLSFSLLLGSLDTVPRTLLSKDLDFGKAVLPEVFANLFYSLSTILLALNGYGIWSLVYGFLIASVASFFTYWYLRPWRINLSLDFAISLELFNFGKYILASGLVTFFILNIDLLFVINFFSLEQVGFYSLAVIVAHYPTTVITHIATRVMFPTFSKIKDRKEDIILFYYNFIKYVSSLTIPMTIGLFVLSPVMVKNFLGENWIGAGELIQILCIYGLLRAYFTCNCQLFNAMNKVNLVYRFNLLQLVIISLIIYPAYVQGGLMGVCLSITLSSLIVVIIQTIYVVRILDINYFDLLNINTHFFISAVVMMIPYLLVSNYLVSSWINTLFFVIGCIFLYFSSLYLITRGKFFSEIRSILN
jgi:O-antigen/teichoic acid export membrane protein